MRRPVAVVVSILVVLSVTLIYLNLPVAPEPLEFRWGVEMGEEFHFGIEVYGSNNNESEPIPFIEFNNTQIVATIFNLPNVTLVKNETDFLNVIEVLKVECRFSNGTSIPADIREGYYGRSNSSIPEIISRAILPVNEWTYLDNLYTDESGYQGDTEWYFSNFTDGTFSFGYTWFYIDFGYGWLANINQTKGNPLSIEFWERDPICIGQYQVIMFEPQ